MGKGQGLPHHAMQEHKCIIGISLFIPYNVVRQRYVVSVAFWLLYPRRAPVPNAQKAGLFLGGGGGGGLDGCGEEEISCLHWDSNRETSSQSLDAPTELSQITLSRVSKITKGRISRLMCTKFVARWQEQMHCAGPLKILVKYGEVVMYSKGTIEPQIGLRKKV